MSFFTTKALEIALAAGEAAAAAAAGEAGGECGSRRLCESRPGGARLGDSDEDSDGPCRAVRVVVYK